MLVTKNFKAPFIVSHVINYLTNYDSIIYSLSMTFFFTLKFKQCLKKKKQNVIFTHDFL